MAVSEPVSRSFTIVRRGGVGVTIAQYVHLVGAALAAGSAVFLMIALLPSLPAIGATQADRLMGDMIWRVRIIFWMAILCLSLGGLYLTIVGSGVTSFAMLFGTTYGRVLAVKIIVALIASTLVLLLTLPFPFLAGFQAQIGAVLPVAFLITGTAALLGAVLRRMRTAYA